MANWNVTKTGFGKLTFARISWTTSVAMYYAETDSPTAGLEAAWASSSTSHAREFSFDFSRQGTYTYRTRNRNKCYTWCAYSAWKSFSVNRYGDIYAQS